MSPSLELFYYLLDSAEAQIASLGRIVNRGGARKKEAGIGNTKYMI
jgi:hypothetical protein